MGTYYKLAIEEHERDSPRAWDFLALVYLPKVYGIAIAFSDLDLRRRVEPVPIVPIENPEQYSEIVRQRLEQRAEANGQRFAVIELERTISDGTFESIGGDESCYSLRSIVALEDAIDVLAGRKGQPFEGELERHDVRATLAFLHTLTPTIVLDFRVVLFADS